MDGETTIRLANLLERTEGELIFEGFVETPGHHVAVSDMSGEVLLEIEVPSSITRLTIWANDSSEPDLILIEAR